MQKLHIEENFDNSLNRLSLFTILLYVSQTKNLYTLFIFFLIICCKFSHKQVISFINSNKTFHLREKFHVNFIDLLLVDKVDIAIEFISQRNFS